MQPQIVFKELVKPANPTPPHLRSLKISSIDQFHPPSYVSHIFCYPAENKDDSTKNTERTKQLQKSLSEILTLFYPFAGRYVKENLSIDCNDNGVEYTEAKIATDLAPFLKNDADGQQLIHLVQYQTESSSSPLLSVQFNMFECGGLVIGACMSHRIIDATFFSKFLNGWATATRVGNIHEVDRPQFNLFSILPTREMVPELRYLPPIKPGLNIVSKTFVFDRLSISNLRKYFKLSGGGKYDQPTREHLVTGVIWKALIRVSEAKHGKLRSSVIALLLSLRGRTQLPIWDDYWGNLIRPVIARFTREKKSNNNLEFQKLVFLLRDAITNVVNDCSKIKSSDDFFSTVNHAWREANEEFEREGIDAHFLTSACGIPFYLDFGWGKPARTSHVQSAVEMIVLMDTRDGDGIEARICLDEKNMTLFQQDQDIIAFTFQEEQHDRPNVVRSRC